MHSFLFPCRYWTYDKTKFSALRRNWMDHGDFLDRASRVPDQKVEADGEFLPLDVSDLWGGGISAAGYGKTERKKHLEAGRGLYVFNLCGGIYQRHAAEKA